MRCVIVAHISHVVRNIACTCAGGRVEARAGALALVCRVECVVRIRRDDVALSVRIVRPAVGAEGEAQRPSLRRERCEYSSSVYEQSHSADDQIILRVMKNRERGR